MKNQYQQCLDEINQMVILDQDLRGGSNIDWKKVEAVDKKHTERMKEIIKEIGFPSISKLGKMGSQNAWLLVQHSPDVQFMKSYLAMMEAESDREYSMINYAYLKDRILLNDNEPQIYGTQVITNNETKKTELYKVIDPDNLDKRRKAIGLEPIEEYMKNFG